MKARYFVLDNHCKTKANFNCFFAYGKNQKSDLHHHDYYEIFITITPNIVHVVNGVHQVLPSGTLAFIRPNDVHQFCFDPDVDSRHINLSFNKKILDSLFEYLSDENFPANDLLNSELPPMCNLNKRERNRLTESLYAFNNNFDAPKNIDLKMRVFLADVFARYFSSTHIKSQVDNMPYWLESTCDKMNEYNNFYEGIERMIEISGKSREHLYRSVQKYMGMTVSEYINNLRLNYAASMLINSNLPVLDICFESGFQNLGHFYTLFTAKFAMSPKKFRDKSKQDSAISYSVIIEK